MTTTVLFLRKNITSTTICIKRRQLIMSMIVQIKGRKNGLFRRESCTMWQLKSARYIIMSLCHCASISLLCQTILFEPFLQILVSNISNNWQSPDRERMECYLIMRQFSAVISQFLNASRASSWCISLFTTSIFEAKATRPELRTKTPYDTRVCLAVYMNIGQFLLYQSMPSIC